MAENLINEQGTDTIVDNAQYIEAIEQLKANSVDKARFEALKAENKQLLDTLINGGSIEIPEVKEKVDLDALRKELFDPYCQISNLEYAEKALKLREGVLAQGGTDPFLPVGKNIAPTAEDVACAEKVAEAFKSCIEYADGNAELFTQELMRVTKDAAPMAGRRK